MCLYRVCVKVDVFGSVSNFLIFFIWFDGSQRMSLLSVVALMLVSWGLAHPAPKFRLHLVLSMFSHMVVISKCFWPT